MSLHESDREDLLRDATALVERAMVRVPGVGEEVLVGFRPDGCLSLYVGSDPVYHFDSLGRLRRGFCDGRLLKAEGGRLATLARHRTDEETRLVRHDLDASEQAELLARLGETLAALRTGLQRGEVERIGQVPAEADVAARTRTWLEQHVEVEVAESPRVG